MDQKKQGQQSEGFKGQQQQKQPPEQQQQGSQPPGQQKSQEPQTQNPNREPAEGPQNTPGTPEKGGGITNRDLDREKDEQDQLPERGGSRESER